MRHYTQLTQEERYQIHALMKADHSLSEIARILGRSKSTIGRELRRNKGLRGYHPKQAHRLALERRQAKYAPRIPEETWQWVERLLREDWRPEQISRWLAREKRRRVSHERIYRHILQDKRAGATCTRLCVAKSLAGSATGLMTVEAGSRIRNRSRSARPSWSAAAASETGNWIRSSARATRACWSRWWRGNPD